MTSSSLVGGYPYLSSAEQLFFARGHLKISKRWTGHKVIFKKSYFLKRKYRVTQKNGKFWKPQQKLKKSKKKKLLTEIEPLQLAF